MAPKLLPLKNNEFNDYLFEVWQLGYKVSQHLFNDLNHARAFYAANGDSHNYALKLFINGEPVNFLDMSKVLKISRGDKIKLKLIF